jgi:cytosine/adenosine deaminase-related metal-dependent hydrolase
MKLHRAQVVVPAGGPPIADGAVLTADAAIVEVGPFARLKGQAPVVDHGEAILTPALINCHAHLELSHLAALGQGTPRQGDMAGWIGDLLAARQQAPATDLAAARRVLDDFYRQGVGWVLDVGNQPESAAIGAGHAVQVRFFLEMLGLAERSAEHALARMDQAQGDCTGHAPYTNHPRLLAAVKQRAGARNQLFSIHAAESAHEMLFLRDGTGPLRRLIEQRGFWDGSFVPPGCGAVAYLDRLGVIDDHTLCVHCVQVSDEEIDLLARRRATVCLCPGSNRHLGVGRAPAAKMAAAGIVIGLGTDSAASNPRLSLWEEMRLLRADHPGLSPESVFAMATRNGARILGLPAAGELAAGRRAAVLAVAAPGITTDRAYDFLTTAGPAAKVSWAEEGRA